MDKQALNWLAKEWLKRVAVTGKGYDKPFSKTTTRGPEIEKILSMMDTSKRRISAPGWANNPQFINGIKSQSIIVEDYPNLRNEYARIFLTKAMKSKGSIDELAVRQFVKENPKMVEQLLVKNDAIPAGLSVRDAAKRLSEMYPDGMIKGPVAYERGITGYAQRQFDQLKKVNLKIDPASQSAFFPYGKGTIVIPGKRQDPVGFLHEVSEAKHLDPGKGISLFYSGDKWKGLLENTKGKEKDLILSDAYKMGLRSDKIGLHVSPSVLINERNVMSKIPRYIDPLEGNIGELRRYRDISNEYGTIGTKPWHTINPTEYVKSFKDVYITPPSPG